MSLDALLERVNGRDTNAVLLHNPSLFAAPPSTLNKWNARLQSLLPTSPAQALTLLHTTYATSPSSLAQHGGKVLPLATAHLFNPTCPSATYSAAIALVLLIIERADAVLFKAAVQGSLPKLATALVGTATAGEGNAATALAALIQLIPSHPNPFRPHAATLHQLSLSLLLGPSPFLAEQAATLFGSRLYMLSPGGAAGTRDAWKRGVRAALGSIDAFVTAFNAAPGQQGGPVIVENPIFLPAPGSSGETPLQLPPLPALGPAAALERIERLSRVVLSALRGPTGSSAAEDGLAVDVPVGLVAKVASRMLGLHASAPTAARLDPAALTAVLPLLPRVHQTASTLLLQLAYSLPSFLHLSPHSSSLFSALAAAISSYPAAAPTPGKRVLQTTFCALWERAGVDVPIQEGEGGAELRRALGRTWRGVLDDIAAVNIAVAAPAGGEREEDGQPSKKRARGAGKPGGKGAYDLAALSAPVLAPLSPAALGAATTALVNLTRLLSSGGSSFTLDAGLRGLTVGLLLGLANDPAFFSLSTTSRPERPIERALLDTTFRDAVVAALYTLVAHQSGPGGFLPPTSSGVATLTSAQAVFLRGLGDSSSAIRATSRDALALISASVVHPAVPGGRPSEASLAAWEALAGSGPSSAERVWETLAPAPAAPQKEVDAKEALEAVKALEEEQGRLETEREALQAATAATAATFPTSSFGNGASRNPFTRPVAAASTTSTEASRAPLNLNGTAAKAPTEKEANRERLEANEERFTAQEKGKGKAAVSFADPLAAVLGVAQEEDAIMTIEGGEKGADGGDSSDEDGPMPTIVMGDSDDDLEEDDE